MKSKDGVKKSSLESYTSGYKNRIVRVIDRLEAQLKSKVKPTKDGGTTPLTEADVKRINSEIKILNSK
jgi:hypothetical protein